MKIAFAAFLAVHAAIHLIGVAKAMRRSISRSRGALWLAAALALAATAVLLFALPRWWFCAGVPALVLSQAAIVTAFRDAKWGTLANVVLLVPLAISIADLRPSSLRSRFDDAVAREQAMPRPPRTIVTRGDLESLPAPIQRYLVRVGVVGKPRVRSMHAVFRAQMRNARTDPWMDATVEQYSFFGRSPTRLFFMQASRGGIPFDAFHRYVGPHATFEVRIAGLYPMIDARGPEMDQSETVTMLNDLCLLAPAALIEAPIEWQTIDAHTVRATYTNAGHTVRADLSFDAAGDLVGFVSGDRYQNDGRATHLYPWSTPVERYATTGGFHLWKSGDARWREPAGEWTYARFELSSLDYD